VKQKIVNKRPDLDCSTIFANQVESAAQIWIVAVFQTASPPAIDLGISLECVKLFFQHSNK
jgi:hypothetical protein